MSIAWPSQLGKTRAAQELDRDKVWDCHVHLLGTGDAQASDVWVNPVMDSHWHPVQAVQKQLYLNASCVADGQGVMRPTLSDSWRC